MRKHLATILIIAYLAFAPICFVVLPFLGGTGMHHSSVGHMGHAPDAKSCGAVGECDPMPFDDIDQHATMYHTATASASSAPQILLMSLLVLVTLAIAHTRSAVSRAILKAQINFDHLRQCACIIKRKSLVHWQSLLQNSPNQSPSYA